MNTDQEWHYTDATGQQLGPISVTQLQELSSSGQVTAATQVWTEGMEVWTPASQVDGLIPAPTEQHEHQPQINLGAGSGIHLESAIPAQPMGQSLTTPYTTKSKSPAKAIILSIIAIAAIGTGIYFATLPPEEGTTETPGLKLYTEANDRVSACDPGSIYGNSMDAITIGKNFLAAIKPPKKSKAPAEDTTSQNDTNFDDDLHQPEETAIQNEKPIPAEAIEANELEENNSSAQEKLDISLHCHALNNDNGKSVTLLVKIPKIQELSAEDKKALTSKAWFSAKLALANTPYSDADTTLVLALRGVTTYVTVVVGHPVITQPADEAPTEGISKTYQGKEAEAKLYPYFVRKK